KAGCPSTVTGNQLNPAATPPPSAKNRLLCAARKVSRPVTWRGPGQSSCSAAAMLDLPEQLAPFRTMQTAVIPQGCPSTVAYLDPHAPTLAGMFRLCRLPFGIDAKTPIVPT